jgi:type VI protein secretion system component VasK
VINVWVESVTGPWGLVKGPVPVPVPVPVLVLVLALALALVLVLVLVVRWERPQGRSGNSRLFPTIVVVLVVVVVVVSRWWRRNEEIDDEDDDDNDNEHEDEHDNDKARGRRLAPGVRLYLADLKSVQLREERKGRILARTGLD